MPKIEVQRIQKWLASRGIGSRRQIDKWIADGRLKVNGKVAELGQKVTGFERFALDDKPVRVSPEKGGERKVIMYHKPVGEICTRKDEQNRPSVFRRLPKISHGRWVAIGRLDFNTAGLLLFTNDGDLANKLMHPSQEVEREYWVRVAGEVDNDTLQQLREGFMLEDGFAHFENVDPLKTIHEDDTQYNRYYSVVLKEGRNREVRRLWEEVGCRVNRLKRVRYGNVALPKALSAGRFQYLTDSELKNLVKLAEPKETKPDFAPKAR